ncbi:hypothetical protein THAOC_33023 [Thalassiosira oceanica]|uniref:Uncharacterized protein n=1 Tax=Thalassiosira oceanica TaxID=159749 RepID=K0RN89_THAOC|nr:hypothetical protein THAOC_33023 [Thalassiosira oceanica]|eukprot:EJK48202.1 hypothetical protein THAOC_33023 [Thalassiosira oceanica]
MANEAKRGPDAAEEPQMLPSVVIRSFPEPRARKPHGPQAWAVILTVGCLYYVWTKVLGKSFPTFSRQGQRIGVGGDIKKSARDHQADRLAAIERRQQQQQQQRFGAQKRPNSNITSSKLVILQQQQQQQKEEAEARRKTEEKKNGSGSNVSFTCGRKKRQMKKKIADAKAALVRTDEELGPGWEYRENPSAASASINAMDPQAGSGSGGYKPTKCKPSRGG